MYQPNDICIVGRGCVLPEASRPEEFWTNIISGTCSIRQMPEERFDKRLYFSRERLAKDKSYSSYAGFVDDEDLKKISKRLGLVFSRNRRLEIMSLEATRQAFACLKQKRKKILENTTLFIGCMEASDGFSLENFFAFNKKFLKQYIQKSNIKSKKKAFDAIEQYFNHEVDDALQIDAVLTTSVIDVLKKKFHLKGEGVLVDAACASSLAAIESAVDALKNYETDMAVTGGIESNLRPDSFVLFSKVGALSEKRCLPFDEQTDGLSQGEGAVIFVLQRMEDALRDGNTIYGIIRSVGSASDGNSSSLFSPSIEGQLLSYDRAYQSIDPQSIDYIECHGTGTKLGDKTEINSLNAFFKKKIPIGSVKSLVGHTKGSAGAVGLLKCLLLMEQKIIPPTRYITSSMAPQNGNVYVNKRPLSLRKKSKHKALRCGVSAFGFGNINYHVVVEEWKKEGKIKSQLMLQEPETIVVIGEGIAVYKDIDSDVLVRQFNIPPKSIASIDKIQLLALSAVQDAFEKSHIAIDSLKKESVSVLSASIIGLESALHFSYRIITAEFEKVFDPSDENMKKMFAKYKDRFPEVTEDTGPGILNNVIAGRICNTFDFKGKNFNVDADFNSFASALKLAKRELQKNDGIVILVFCREKLDTERKYILRKDEVSCLLLTTLRRAKEESYPIQKLIQSIRYDE